MAGNQGVLGLILDREQLCQALGVSDSAISAWERKGLPVVRKGRGRGMKSLYDLDAVRAWCARTGYGHSIQTLAARFARIEPAPAPGHAPRPDEPTTTPAAPVQTSARDPEPDPSPPGEDPHGYYAARASREKTQARMAELELLERLGHLVSVAAVERAGSEIWGQVRLQIQSLPRLLDAKLAGEPDPARRSAIWDRELRAFLTQLSALIRDDSNLEQESPK